MPLEGHARSLYRYISVRKASADNSSSLGSKLISSNASIYDFYLRELLRSELTYFTYFTKGRGHRRVSRRSFTIPFPSGGATAPQNCWKPPTSRPRGMTQQPISLGDRTRFTEKFSRSPTPPSLAKKIVTRMLTQMLTNDLFAIASPLVYILFNRKSAH